jgi:ribose 5-phosphate isomerase B
MTRTTVAIGSDHAGFDLKQVLAAYLPELGYEVLDLGTNGTASVDYPDYGSAVAAAVAEGRARFGVVVCGTGIGISIAANRNREVRAAVCHDHVTAEMSRRHNDANILALGARIIGVEVAKECVRTFLTAPFEGGRHAGRVAKLSAIA